MGNWPLAVLKPMTWLTLAVEFLALPMILSPFLQPHLRRIIIVALCVLHVGIGVTTTLTFFAIKMGATFVLLLREDDWREISRLRGSLGRALERLVGVGATQRVRERLGLGKQPASTPSVAAGIPPPSFVTWFRRFGFWSVQATLCVLFATILAENYNLNLRARLQSGPAPEFEWAKTFVLRTQLIQSWAMFAPNPSRDNGWWVFDGKTESGRSLDPLTGQPVSYVKPSGLAASYDRFWQKYLARLWLKTNMKYRHGLARYGTRVNHRSAPAGDRLRSFTLNYMPEVTRAPHAPRTTPKPVRLLSWDCFGGGAPAPATPTTTTAAAKTTEQE